MPETLTSPAPPAAEPTVAQRVGAAAASIDFSKLNEPQAPPAPPAAPKAPEAPRPSVAPAAPATPKPLAIPPLKPQTAQPLPSPDAPTGPDDEVPESIKSTKAADDWRKLHGEAKALRAEVKTKSDELAKLMDRASKPPAEVERLTKQVEELSERLRITDIHNHPKFQAYFGTESAAAIAVARSAVGVDKAEEVTRLLQLPESDYRTDQLDALISDLSPTRQGRVQNAIGRLDKLNTERDQAIERAKRDGTTAQQARQAEQQAHVAKVNQIFDATVKEAVENLPAFQTREGDDAWNAEVANRIATAKHIFTGQMPFEDMARATIWAASAPALNAMALQLTEENKALKAENASLRSKAPSPSGGGDAPPPGDDPNMTVVEAIRKRLASAGSSGMPWQR